MPYYIKVFTGEKKRESYPCRLRLYDNEKEGRKEEGFNSLTCSVRSSLFCESVMTTKEHELSTPIIIKSTVSLPIAASTSAVQTKYSLHHKGL